ncbi:MAG: translocation/assembly module TamB domain-containing protein [Prevotella sp.]|nr:translocation/assembly module TamB domain-containing protein [Candidatus Prevotella equi]
MAIALYIPPIQNWAVDVASRQASKATGMEITIDNVHLVFPLDLGVNGVKVIKPNDSLPQRPDTIADIQRAIVNVRLLPLLDSEVKVKAMEIVSAKVNTADFIHEARIKGFIGRLAVEGATESRDNIEVSLKKELVNIAQVMLDDAHLNIELSDTVPPDTTESKSKWRIMVDGLSVTRSDVVVHMPGDTLQIAAKLDDVKLKNGDFDTGRKIYSLATCALNSSQVKYDNNFATRQQSAIIDPNHITLNDINLRIDSVYYNDPSLKMHVSECAMKEEKGLTLQSLNAYIALDSTKFDVDGTLKTPYSSLYTRTSMDLNAFSEKNPGKVRSFLDASIGKQDIAMVMDGAQRQLVAALPQYPISIKADVTGNMKQVFIPMLSVDMPTAFSLSANGDAKGFMALAENPYSNDFAASLHCNLNTYNMNFVKTLLDKSTAKTINIPSMNAIADMDVRGANYDLRLKAREGKGTLNSKANVNIATMAYNAAVKANALNIGHFVRGMQLGAFTGSLTANGHGTDINSPATKINASADINHFTYGRYNLNNVNATALLHNGRANVNLDSHNSLVDGSINLDALLNTKCLQATLATEINNVDLYKLQLVEAPLTLSLCTHVDVASDFKDYYFIQGLVSDITIRDSANIYRPDDIVMDVLADSQTTMAKIDCGDFLLRFNAEEGYKKLLATSDNLIATITSQIKNRTIDQAELRQNLPTMTLKAHCSKENPIYRFIRYYDVDYNELSINLSTSEKDGINGKLLLNGLSTQGYQLDTINVDIVSYNDPQKIMYNAHIRNVAPNDYVFDVLLNGKLLEHGIVTGGVFYDANHELGMKIGTEATMEDDGIRFRLLPDEPVVAYKPFKLNNDNYVFLANNNKISAHIDLKADDGTGIQLYSTDDEDYVDRLQDLTLSVTRLNLENLLSAIPYAPKVKGLMNGDVHFIQDADKSFSLSTDIATNNLIYEGCKMGNLGTQLVYMPKEDGSHYVDGHLILDDNEIGAIEGSYQFETHKIDASLTLDKLPMSIANGFIPDKIIGFEGTAEGTLEVHGTTDMPNVNGELFLENAALVSLPYGVRMRFDDDPITITDSKLLLENFQMYSNNEQPLILRGDIDFSDMEHINLDVRMKADKFLLVDAKETRTSTAYGQAYVNFLALIKGELDKLQVRGKLEVLPSTNLFYVLRDSPLTTDNRLKELVTFTDFNAEEPLTITRPTVDGLDVNLNVVVDNGSHIKCWLNDSHTNYLDIIGEGDLRMKYLHDELSMTGRYTIAEGEMKYSLPIIPLKTFKIAEGSYIEFFGDVMNPRLNITAIEETKSSVNINGVNQIVRFNTGVNITKTLNDMGLEFTIESPENKIIADELGMKSAEERGKLAVTMLTTGMYLSDGNTQPFSMNSALNSFLQSEINNIAGNALRTLDLSFGMDNSTEADGTMHTNYSFKFAKRFWNNRLAISVGGKISTGPDVSGQNKSFFDNVEAQYRLSDISNQYLHLFYNNSIYDYLEGYVGQYGAGYMWKKKAQTIKEIFKNSPTTTAPAPANKVPAAK